MQLNLDSAIFIGFLVVNLIVGLGHGKGIKTIKDYALGGRNFSTAALVSTIVATVVSGSGFFIILSNTYSDGLYYLIPSLSMGVSLLLTGYFLVPRMGEFLGCTSVAEAMGELYGKEVRLFTAICGIMWTVGGIAVQFKVFGNIFNYFLNVPATYSIFIASAIVILYSSFGGIKAVTYTDIVQFVTFGFAIPLVGIIIWNQIYDSNLSLIPTLQTSKFNYTEVFDFGNPKFWTMLPLFIYFAVPSTDPTYFQRIAMGRSINQVKRAWLIAAILVVLIKLVTAWIPFLIEVINPQLQAGQVINYVADNYAFTGLKGLIIIGIAAMAMSTADSRINAASVLFANDIGTILKIKINELVLSKLFALLLGVFAIYLALSKADLLSIIMTSASFYMATVTVPLLFSIFGFRSTKKSVLIAMISGFMVILTGSFFKIAGDVTIMIGMIVNLLFLLGSHYLLKQPGGWVGIKDNRYLEEARKTKNRKIAKTLAAISNFSFIGFCKKTSPKNELTYMWLGIYFIILTFTTMYSTHASLIKENGRIILTIYQIMMITGTMMGLYPIWPARIKHEIIMQVAWNIVIFYMLIFFSCFFVMVSNFGQLQFGVFILNMLIAVVLTGWRLGLSMAIAGFYLSIQFYKYYKGIDAIDIGISSPQFIFAYALILAGVALLMFLKPKQEHQALTEEKVDHLNGRISVQEKQIREALALRQEFIRNISHEYHAPMTGIYSMTDALIAAYHKLDDQKRLSYLQSILKSALRLEIFDSNISSLAVLSKAGYKLNLQSLNLSELVYERAAAVRKLYEENQEDREFILDIEENIIINGDEFYLVQTLDNLIVNAITYCKKGRITVTLKKNNAEIEFVINDEGIGIPVGELSNIFGEFVVSSKTHTQAGYRGVGLALCKKVIETHSGTIKAESNGTKGAKLSFVLPNKLT